MTEITVVLDNIRSTHNVGSILRTCDGFGINKVYVCGLTPYPHISKDDRLPHVAKRAHDQIAKTALGAEETVTVKHFDKLNDAMSELKHEGFKVWAVEQDINSAPLNEVRTIESRLAIVLGNEIGGVNMSAEFDKIIEIPMVGHKESFNVSVTAGIVIYHLMQQ